MLYDYVCQSCEEVFEVRRRLDDETPVRCPTCESTDVKKLFLSISGIFVYWRKSLGLGHKGSIVLPAVQNKPLMKSMKLTRRSDEDEFQPCAGSA